MTDLSSHHLARIEAAHDRVSVVESRVGALETTGARTDERLRNIQQSLDGIQSTMSKLSWLIIAGIVSAAVAFVVRGGLNGVQ